jgi:hypothetical protein
METSDGSIYVPAFNVQGDLIGSRLPKITGLEGFSRVSYCKSPDIRFGDKTSEQVIGWSWWWTCEEAPEKFLPVAALSSDVGCWPRIGLTYSLHA